MQTHEWEELLDGTTPGPWEAREDHGGMNLFAGSERVFGADSCGDVSGEEEDVRLAAHAPAAVAEVVRLRRELERLKGDLSYSAMCAKAQGESGAVQTSAAKRLTRILEGGNHE